MTLLTNLIGNSNVPVGGHLELPDAVIGNKINIDGQIFIRSGYVETDPTEYDVDFWTNNFLPHPVLWSLTDIGATGNLRGIANDGNGTWIITGDGGLVYRSTDNGITWSTIDTGTGFFHGFIDTDSNGVWIAIRGDGNYSSAIKSIDNGVTWTAFSLPHYAYNIKTDKNGVWLFTSTSGLIYRSIDNGVTWTQRSGEVGSVDLYSLDTNGSGIWIAGGYGRKLSKSIDNGITWTNVSPSSATSYEFKNINYLGNDSWFFSLNNAAGYYTIDNLATNSYVALPTPFTYGCSINLTTGLFIGSNGSTIIGMKDGYVYSIINYSQGFMGLSTDSQGKWIGVGNNGVVLVFTEIPPVFTNKTAEKSTVFLRIK